MVNRLVSTLAIASAATSIAFVAPAPAQAATAKASAVAEAQRGYIRTKIYKSKCPSTCRIKMRITNISGKNLFSMNARVTLYVNGHKMGRCSSWVGSLRAHRARNASCTVHTTKLTRYWDRWEAGELSKWRPYADVSVYYKYYR